MRSESTRRRARGLLPAWALKWARARGFQLHPPRGLVRFGSLRRLDPVSTEFGFDRGTPIDRYYIGRFLEGRSGSNGDIRGRVLEIGDDTYVRTYGRSGDVDSTEILDVDPDNPRATIVADLVSADDIPDGSFDCMICTQTLHFLYDIQAAVRTLHRILAPGGVALVTVPGISKICRPEADRFGDYWRFTADSLARLLGDVFGAANVTVETYGNVLAAGAFLHGLAAEELHREELDYRDRDFEVVVAARAIKAPAPASDVPPPPPSA